MHHEKKPPVYFSKVKQKATNKQIYVDAFVETNYRWKKNVTKGDLNNCTFV